jgi:hypothetical protein
MNIERLKIEAERLRNWSNPNRHFDMRGFVTVMRETPGLPCRTSCCIAGDIYLEHSGKLIARKAPSTFEVSEFARQYLDLTERQADWLFCGEFTDNVLAAITREMAADAIDLLIACEGRIDEEYGRVMLPQECC